MKPMLNLLLPNDDLRDQLYDYIPLLLAEYRGNLEALFITQVRGRWAAAGLEAWFRGGGAVSPGEKLGLALAGFLPFQEEGMRSLRVLEAMARLCVSFLGLP